MQYENFYETVKESTIRLRNTVVTYDGEPYNVICIAKDPEDGLFRIYLEEIGKKAGHAIFDKYSSVPVDVADEVRKEHMDAWMRAHPDPDDLIIRKKMNSPAFNKFRPFDLGMANINGSAYFIERAPQRHTQQGLTNSMLSMSPVGSNNISKVRPSVVSDYMKDCIKGVYPSFNESLAAVLDPDIQNTSVAFSREFAIVLGAAETPFLSYQTNICGLIAKGLGNDVVTTLGRKYHHLKEKIEGLGIFSTVGLR